MSGPVLVFARAPKRPRRPAPPAIARKSVLLERVRPDIAAVLERLIDRYLREAGFTPRSAS